MGSRSSTHHQSHQRRSQSVIYLVNDSLIHSTTQVPSDEDPSKDEKLAKHLQTYPDEASPLQDTALSFGGKPHSPHQNTNTKPFIPIGHISLDAQSVQAGNNDLADSARGIYAISTFYVSWVLQGTGLGRAAMDAVEHMASKEPLCAKVLALDTIADDFEGKEERDRALERPVERVCFVDLFCFLCFCLYRRSLTESFSKTEGQFSVVAQLLMDSFLPFNLVE